MADHRHKRDTEARRKPKAMAVIGPLAVLATAGAVSIGVLAAGPAASDLTTTRDGVTAQPSSPARTDGTVSRSEDRVRKAPTPPVPPNLMSKAAIASAIAKARTRQWTTDELNIWTQPGDKAVKLGELEAGKKVLVTGRSFWGRVEIVLDGKSRWVTAGYLSDEEPPKLGGACANGTSVPSGVDDGIRAIHQSVCANFPEITVYGTLRGGGGDHGAGKAVDIMVSGDMGWEVAEFVRANAAAFGVNYVIHAQKIWSVQRSGEGWRGMSNRGSVTANHYDHVHVSVY